MSENVCLWNTVKMRGNIYLTPLHKLMLGDGVLISREVAGEALPIPVLFDSSFIIAKFKKTIIDDLSVTTDEELETVIDLLRSAFRGENATS